METLFTKWVSVKPIIGCSIPGPAEAWVKESLCVLGRGGKNLLHDRKRCPWYNLLLVTEVWIICWFRIRFHSKYSPLWGWRKELGNWELLEWFIYSHQTVLGGYQATVSKASWQFSLGFLSPFLVNSSLLRLSSLPVIPFPFCSCWVSLYSS